jgi:hypothetical protein
MSDNEVKAQPAQLRMTVSITRKATGKVETYELVGNPVMTLPERPVDNPYMTRYDEQPTVPPNPHLNQQKEAE